LALFGQIDVFAQKTWPLDLCINYAWDNNFSIHTSELDVRIRKTDYQQALNDLLPSISLRSTLNQNFGRSIDPTTNSYLDVNFFNNDYGISSEITLFNGFMKLNTIKMQRLNLETEKNQLKQIKNQVAFAVINSYFDVMLQQGLFTIARENLQLSRDQLDFTRKLVEVGKKPGTDLLETEANMTTDNFLLVQSYNLLDQSMLGLKYQMNFPVEDSLVIESLTPSIFLGSIDTLTTEGLFRAASTALLDLTLARNQLLVSQSAVQISKGAFSPRLVAYAGWGSQFMETNRDELNNIIPYTRQISNNSNEYISLALEIPLFSKFSKSTSLRKSKLQYQKAKIQYDDVTYKLNMTVQKSLTEWRAARAEYESSLSQLAKSREAYEAAEKKLDKGLINIIEFNIQKNKWFRAKTEVLRTGLQVLLKERYIRFLMTGSLLSA
jgi:outer membrane protein TolC